uniref:TTF-type domain-containing protein n=1 Tax=Latimeria chalumnae TaxID=7897 RepID=H3AEK7_LATCH
SIYYNKFPWIEYSVRLDTVFCFPCRHFYTEKGYVDDLFIGKGLRDWKKLSEKPSKHANSQVHINNETIRSHKADVERNRLYLAKVCDILKLLSKLGLPFRGHDEGKDSKLKGNFLEFCDFFSKYDESFQKMQQSHFNCTSHEFQNEVLHICADLVTKGIVEAVRKTGFFTVIADEARSFKTEQLSLCIKYAENLEVRERFLCFIDCSSSRGAEGIYSCIKKALEKRGLQNLPVVAHSYDGAAVMSGHVSGVQQRMKTDHPAAVYVHCMAHKLNLVLVSNRTAVGFFNVIEKLYNLFAVPSNHQVFLGMQQALGLKPQEIVQLSDTQWACKWKSVLAVRMQYTAIIKSLEKVSDPAGKWSVEASGLNQHMRRLQFIACLLIFQDLLNVAHRALQAKGMTLAKASDIIERLKSFFKKRRSDESWSSVWEDITRFCQGHNILQDEANDCQVPKRRRVVKSSATLKDFLVSDTLGQILDAMNGKLERQFSKESMAIAGAVDSVLKCEKDGVQSLLQQYADPLNINPYIVASQMELFASTDCSITLEKLLHEVSPSLYPNHYKLIQLYLTLPVGTATSERSFSAMRRIRNWLRSTMASDRCSSLALLHIECDMTAKLIPEDIIDVYASQGKRRMQLQLIFI